MSANKTELFISTLQQLGGSATDSALRKALDWPKAVYDNLKKPLLGEGRIVQESKSRIALQTLPASAEKSGAPAPLRRSVLKKSDLYRSLWASCDELRGGMDASQYKDYVLSLLFIKYISDKYAGNPYAAVEIPAGASFADMVALKGKKDIGDRINKDIIGKLVEKNQYKLSHSDFPDFNDPNKLGEGAAMVERLGNLIAIFEKPELNFSGNRADHDDLLGDAYEYLMRHFAQDSGKSKGQFYTPSEVSRIVAKIVGITPANSSGSTTAYDPACGSGSLLLKVAFEAGKRITLEGQEKDVTTAGLARMNMILHDFAGAEIQNGDTLANPKFKRSDDESKLRTYDYVVANPPFSDKSWSTGLNPAADPYQRFNRGVPPAKQGDYAWLLHVLRSMNRTGKAAIILPHGVLFRGNAESTIRKKLIKEGLIKGIIGLPANLFYGVGIPVCIVVLDKENAGTRKGIFMLDASAGFIKDGPKNRLREQDIHRIVDTFNRLRDVPHYARMVPKEEILGEKNDGNLNLPRYIESAAREDRHDISAHLYGGIPEADLEQFAGCWQAMPRLRADLFAERRPGYASLRLPLSELRQSLQNHDEFKRLAARAEERFKRWQQRSLPLLAQAQPKPKAWIEELSESLLAAFDGAPLLDAYAIFQTLMDYWNQSLHDDIALIAAIGWQSAATPLPTGKGKKASWHCDLLPKPYIVAHFFADKQATIEQTQAELESCNAQLAELEEQHGGEEGLFVDLLPLNERRAKDRLQSLTGDAENAEEREALHHWLQGFGRQKALKEALKDKEAELDRRAFAQYAKLSLEQVQELVIQGKWLAHLHGELQKTLQASAQQLATSLAELAERYQDTLQALEQQVTACSAKVQKHLQQMGAA